MVVAFLNHCGHNIISKMASAKRSRSESPKTDAEETPKLTLASLMRVERYFPEAQKRSRSEETPTLPITASLKTDAEETAKTDKFEELGCTALQAYQMRDAWNEIVDVPSWKEQGVIG